MMDLVEATLKQRQGKPIRTQHGCKLIYPIIHRDSRGLFFESWKSDIEHVFVQDNVSISKIGVIRGLHYQRDPKAQGKLIRVLKGSIYDVALNLRTGNFDSGILSDFDHRALYIPPGFAHGFQALEEDTIIQYKVTEFYSKEHEACINPLDESLGIEWPIAVTKISEKDKMGEPWAAVRK